MKTLVSATCVAFVLVLTAGTAGAGLHFADSFTTQPAFSTANTTFTFNATAGTVNPAGTLAVASTLTGSTPQTGVFDVSWTTNAADLVSGANSPDLIVWFGSISSGGIILSSVGVSTDGSTFVQQVFGSFIGTTWSNRPYGITFSDASVTPAQRTAVQKVRLTFAFNASESFTVDGVSTPEPGTFALFGLGLLGLGGAAVRRRRKAKKAV